MTRRDWLWRATLAAAAVGAGCHRASSGPGAAGSPRPGTSTSGHTLQPAGGGAFQFVDATQAAGLHFTHSAGERTGVLPEDMGSGLAWGDYDNDGYPDLYVVNQTGAYGSSHIQGPGNRLFRSQRDGTFRDVTDEAGLTLHHFGMGAFWADYDNDGYLDLLVTGVGGCYLYHNEGNGRFRDVSASSGVFTPGWTSGAVWFDFDRDGWLDLYLLRYVDYPADPASLKFLQASQQYGLTVPPALNPQSFTAQPNRLLRNNRDGTFSDVTAWTGMADRRGRSLTATVCDFNADGWPDIYVGNDLSENRFYLNRRGRFIDRSAQTWTAENKGSMGLAVGDYNGDGALDFFVAHWLSLGDSLYENLWLQTGAKELAFTDAAADVGLAYISLPMVGWGCSFLDFDNDGMLDLFVVNGSTLENPRQPELLAPQKPFLFRFDGQEYHDVTATAAPSIARPLNARGLALADYDRDGDLDAAISSNRGPLILLRAEGAEKRNWLQIELEGRKSNRQGIGALVRVAAENRKWVQAVGSQGSYLSQHATALHFGLGEAAKAERVEILWPSGRRQILTGVAARQRLKITEEA